MNSSPYQRSGNSPPDTKAEAFPVWKRAIDIGLCLAALPALALFVLLTASVMAVVSPGPVMFRQERIGYRGRRYMCYKFRTMQVGADSGIHQRHCEEFIRSDAPMMKMDAGKGARLIPGGRLIRASGMNELPQIVNVLRGEMSLVGPRPGVPYEFDHCLPWQRARFEVRPGLTGLWQVSGKNRMTFEEMVRLDIHYAARRSFWLDLRIICMTAPTLIRQLLRTSSQRRVPGYSGQA